MEWIRLIIIYISKVNISNHQVKDEVKKRANTKDDGSLPEKGAAVRLSVLMCPGRSREEHQQVQQEQAGHQQQVDEERVPRLKVVLVS